MFRQASDREAVYACFTFSHWLVYANSAANPIIYNFLSGKWTTDMTTVGGHGPLGPSWAGRGGCTCSQALVLWEPIKAPPRSHDLSSDPQMYPGWSVIYLHTSAHEEGQGLGPPREQA